MVTEQERVIEHVRIACQDVLRYLPLCGLTQQELEDQSDFWVGKMTIAEERLYAIRHGDTPR